MRLRTAAPGILAAVLWLAPGGEAADLAAVRAAGVLRVGTNLGMRPMAYVEGGKPVGYDVDLAAALAKKLGVGLEWVNHADFGALKALVRSGDYKGRFDVVISAMGIDDEKLKRNHAVPYFESGLTILATRADPTITDLASLSGKRVAVVNDTSEHHIVEKEVKDVTFVVVGDYAAVVAKVASGAADAAPLDVPPALDAAKRNPNLRVVKKPFEREWYGVFLEKSSGELYQAVKAAVDALKADGTLDATYRKWF